MRISTIEKIRAKLRTNQPGIVKEIEELLDQEERAEKMAEDTKELIYLANVTASYMSMPVKHPMYCKVGADVRGSLARLFDKEEG